MKPFKDTVLAIAVGAFAMVSLALSANDSEAEMVMVKINKSDNDEAMVDLEVDGNAEMFSLPDLQIGETKTITTQSGKNILVSKTEEGVSIELDGKTVELPSFSGNLGARIHRAAPLHQIVEDSVQISGVKLDDNQKQIIEDAFRAAGIDKKLTFNEHTIHMFSAKDGFEFVSDGEEVHTWHANGDAKIKVLVNEDSEDGVLKIKKKHIIIEKKED